MKTKLSQNRNRIAGLLIPFLPLFANAGGMTELSSQKNIIFSDSSDNVLYFLQEDFNVESHFASQNNKLYDFIYQILSTRLRLKSRSWAQPLTESILKEAQKNHLDPMFLLSQMDHESRFDLDAVGTHGEIGLFQIKPSTAKTICKKEGITFSSDDILRNPVLNLKISVSYLMELRRHFPQYSTAFLDAYNLGPHRLKLRIQANNLSPSRYSLNIRAKLIAYYRMLKSSRLLAAR